MDGHRAARFSSPLPTGRTIPAPMSLNQLSPCRFLRRCAMCCPAGVRVWSKRVGLFSLPVFSCSMRSRAKRSGAAGTLGVHGLCLFGQHVGHSQPARKVRVHGGVFFIVDCTSQSCAVQIGERRCRFVGRLDVGQQSVRAIGRSQHWRWQQLAAQAPVAARLGRLRRAETT